MSKVLYIQASPRHRRSHSIAVADRFLAEYRKKYPADEVVTLNLFDIDLPTFDGYTIQAKYSVMHGQKHSVEEAVAWGYVEREIALFKSADRYIFAVPMWNFGIPYRLKQYIDIIVQPTYTFTITPQGGYEGLIKGKKAFVAYARGGEYPAGPMSALDLQKPYLELILGFVGITDVRSIVIEPTLGAVEVSKKRQEEALAAADGMVAGF